MSWRKSGTMGGAKPQRALLFRVPGEESAINARRLSTTLALAGVETEVLPYWPDGWCMRTESAPLLETDIGSAPRLTAREFRRRFGFSLDLIDLSAHQFATEPITPRLILAESGWSRHLRGVAVLAHERILASRPDLVLIPHGAETISRILAEMATAADRRLMFWESGFFFGHLYLDSQAPHFFRGEARIDSLPLPEKPSSRSVDFHAQWQGVRRSKYPQQTLGYRQEQVSAWLASDPRPVLFLPGQTPHDANVVVGLGRFDDLGGLYREALVQVPENWRVLYKPHPLASTDPMEGYEAPPDRFMSADINILDAIEASTTVLTVSSNAGLEALLLGRPVIVLGKPIYSGRGVTHDLDDPAALGSILASGHPAPPDDSKVLAFLDLLLAEALISDGDVDGLLSRMTHARPRPQASRLGFYGRKVRDVADASRALDTALHRHRTLDRALRALPAEQRAVLEERVGLATLAEDGTVQAQAKSSPIGGLQRLVRRLGGMRRRRPQTGPGSGAIPLHDHDAPNRDVID